MDQLRSQYLYWSDKAIIERLQRLVIIHSIIYYKLNTSIVSDEKYDRISKQLVMAQKSFGNRETKANTKYGYALHDFDATTGFHIEARLNKKDRWYLLGLAKHVLWLHKQNGKG